MRDDKDGTLFGIILIPSYHVYLDSVVWIYELFHELGHCNLSTERPKGDDPSFPLDKYELYADLVAFCSLREIFPVHKKTFRAIIQHESYVGTYGLKYFGKKLQKRVLDNPEIVLKEFIEQTFGKKG